MHRRLESSHHVSVGSRLRETVLASSCRNLERTSKVPKILLTVDILHDHIYTILPGYYGIWSHAGFLSSTVGMTDESKGQSTGPEFGPLPPNN